MQEILPSQKKLMHLGGFRFLSILPISTQNTGFLRAQVGMMVEEKGASPDRDCNRNRVAGCNRALLLSRQSGTAFGVGDGQMWGRDGGCMLRGGWR
jgi:hypothetical protein